MIVAVLGLATVAGISARATVLLADTIFDKIINIPRKSTHIVCGHTFVVSSTEEYSLLEDAYTEVVRIANEVVRACALPDTDTPIFIKFVFDGIMVWGSSGTDLRAVVAAQLLDDERRPQICECIMNSFEAVSPQKKQALLRLHTFAA
jgi:hypothetical protein